MVSNNEKPSILISITAQSNKKKKTLTVMKLQDHVIVISLNFYSIALTTAHHFIYFIQPPSNF